MILVTGAAGTVGAQVVKALSAQVARFRVGYRNRKPASGMPAVSLDLDRPETLAPALAGVETVFLLSSDVGSERNLVRAAKPAGVRRIVKLSVFGAAEEAFSFAKWHRSVEREIEQSGLVWTFLRPNSFMQNVVNFMGATIKAQNAFYEPAGESRIGHIDARDIGAVAARVITEGGHGGKAYTLTGPRAITYGEIAELLSRTLGRKITYVDVSEEDYKRGAMAAGMPESYADALVDLSRYYRTGAAARLTNAVQELTGRAPLSFEQFALDHAEALR